MSSTHHLYYKWAYNFKQQIIKNVIIEPGLTLFFIKYDVSTAESSILLILQ